MNQESETDDIGHLKSDLTELPDRNRAPLSASVKEGLPYLLVIRRIGVRMNLRIVKGDVAVIFQPGLLGIDHGELLLSLLLEARDEGVDPLADAGQLAVIGSRADMDVSDEKLVEAA
jgi:hypothetical protein